MANCLHLGGPDMNNLTRAVTPIFSLTPGSDALFPSVNLYDRIQDIVWKASSNASALAIAFDQNLIPGGNLDTWVTGLPSPGSWFTTLTGTATVLQTSVAGEVVTGSAAKLTAGTGTAMLVYPIPARAGETLYVSVDLRGDAVNNARVQVYNRHTGKYWDGVSSWSSSSAQFVTGTFIPRSANTYTTGNFAINVESFLLCGTDSPVIELRLASSAAAGIAYFDNVFVWPQASFLGVFGHNLDPVATPSWYYSDDGVTTTLRTALTPYKPSVWATNTGAGASRRYQHLVLSTTNGGSGTPWIGEVVVGPHTTLTRGPNYGLQVTPQFPQLRSYSASGAKRSGLLSQYERRSVMLQFRHAALTQYQEARDAIFRQTRAGHYPSVLVPASDDAEVAMFGYITNPWGPVTVPSLGVWDSDLAFEEEPHPVLTS